MMIEVDTEGDGGVTMLVWGLGWGDDERILKGSKTSRPALAGTNEFGEPVDQMGVALGETERQTDRER